MGFHPLRELSASLRTRLGRRVLSGYGALLVIGAVAVLGSVVEMHCGSAAPVFTAPPPGEDERCNGEVPASLVAELSSRGDLTRPCYEQAAARDGSLQGRMQVTIVVSPDLSARAVVTRDETNSAAMRACVVAIFERPFRSAPTGGCANVVVPLRFHS